MKDIILTEKWKRFLTEGINADLYGLYVYDGGHEYLLCLYRRPIMPGDTSKIVPGSPAWEEKWDLEEQKKADWLIPPVVVGMAHIALLSGDPEPCIPTTYQVSHIARDSATRGQGIGTLMYELAAAVALKNGGGITSDHKHSSSTGAYKAWQRLEKNTKFEKNTTAAGNDTFDYKQKTPDKEDDCVQPKGDEYTKNAKLIAAVDHSYKLKKIPRLYFELVKNFMMDKKNMGKNGELLSKLLFDQAQNLFQDEYIDTKKLTKDYLSWWNRLMRYVGIQKEQKTWRNFIREVREQKRVIIIPGGFKPPHKGHVEMINHYLQNYPDAEIVVYSGSKPRMGGKMSFGKDKSLQIFDLYKDAGVFIDPSRLRFNFDLTQREKKGGGSWESPFRDAIELAETGDVGVGLGYSEKDAAYGERFAKAGGENAFDPGAAPNVDDMHASDFREAIASKDVDAIKQFLPRRVDSQSFMELFMMEEGGYT